MRVIDAKGCRLNASFEGATLWILWLEERWPICWKTRGHDYSLSRFPLPTFLFILFKSNGVPFLSLSLSRWNKFSSLRGTERSGISRSVSRPTLGRNWCRIWESSRRLAEVMGAKLFRPFYRGKLARIYTRASESENRLRTTAFRLNLETTAVICRCARATFAEYTAPSLPRNDARKRGRAWPWRACTECKPGPRSNFSEGTFSTRFQTIESAVFFHQATLRKNSFLPRAWLDRLTRPIDQ